jgi:hypothetical protein
MKEEHDKSCPAASANSDRPSQTHLILGRSPEKADALVHRGGARGNGGVVTFLRAAGMCFCALNRVSDEADGGSFGSRDYQIFAPASGNLWLRPKVQNAGSTPNV